MSPRLLRSVPLDKYFTPGILSLSATEDLEVGLAVIMPAQYGSTHVSSPAKMSVERGPPWKIKTMIQEIELLNSCLISKEEEMTAKINEMRERFLGEYNEAKQQHMTVQIEPGKDAFNHMK
ncbi:hypothetical protein ACTXT7_014482 [Hymenolepis weldensis]